VWLLLRCAEVAQAKQAAGGFWVLRPDSGDPVEVVLMVSVCNASTMYVF
jgi:nicotinic acid phosphoribosyltransferase